MGKNHEETCESLRTLLDAETVMALNSSTGEEVAVAGDANLARAVCEKGRALRSFETKTRSVDVVDTGTDLVTCAIVGTETLTMVALYTHHQARAETHLNILAGAAELLDQAEHSGESDEVEDNFRDKQTGLLTLAGLRAGSEGVFEQANRNEETVSVAVVTVGIVAEADVGVSGEQSDGAIAVMVNTLLPSICRASDLVARIGPSKFAILFTHGHVPVEAVRARAAVATAVHNRSSGGDQISLAVGVSKSNTTCNIDQLVDEAADWAQSDRAARRGTVTVYS